MTVLGGTKKSAAVWGAALILVAGYSVTASVITQRSNEGEAAQASIIRVEQYLQHFVSTQQFMGSVLIAKGDAVLLDKGYGFSDLARRAPNSPKTRFMLASVSKQFTAASILLLEERGKLRLDDPLSKYLPSTPAVWGKITIFNLLTHTSGIPNYTSFPEAAFSTPTTPDKQIATFINKPLDFSPGQRWSYSNSNYVLLGYLIQRISGESYGAFLRENIFLPLGMRDSGYDSRRSEALAIGYYTPGDKPIPAPPIEPSAGFAAGGLYSTTRDLLIWERALFGGRVISSSSLKKMTTPFKNGYALGLIVDKANGPISIWHGGFILGAYTRLVYYPQVELTVVVLSNVFDGQSDEIQQNIAALAAGAGLQHRFGEPTLPSPANSLALPTNQPPALGPAPNPTPSSVGILSGGTPRVRPLPVNP
jgi:CubicO group peptidase (beta-lactamase class C family)